MSTLDLDELYRRLQERAEASPDESWTARLLTSEPERVARKFGEEAVELVIEAIRKDKEKIISESADVLYHLSVLWLQAGVKPADIAEVLKTRQSQSGLAEKESRKPAASSAPPSSNG